MRQADTGSIPLGGHAAVRVFTTVLTQGPLSRVELTQRTGLSAATVTKAVRPLLAAGYLLERTDADTARRIGRPAAPLGVHADREFFVGVKITADQLIGAVTDLRARPRVTRHLPLPDRDVDTVVTAVGELVGQLLSAGGTLRAHTRQLVVALAGDVDRRTGLVRYSPFLEWHDVALAHRVQAVTGLDTAVENDVRALTAAEHWFGSGAGTSSFALVTVGTGIGCGIVLGDTVVSGAHGVAGEIGHLPIEPDGPLCHCGNRGCVEAIASDPAIVDRIRAATGRRRMTIAEAVTAARGGEAVARDAYARAGHAIGLALSCLANMLGPERIIISGEGLAAYDLFAHQIRDTFAAHAFGSAADCELIVRPLPFEQWACGAAAVAIQHVVAADSH